MVAYLGKKRGQVYLSASHQGGVTDGTFSTPAP